MCTVLLPPGVNPTAVKNKLKKKPITSYPCLLYANQACGTQKKTAVKLSSVSHLLSLLRITTYTTVMLYVILYKSQTWYLTLRMIA
jgi:hypothetical protein